MSETHTQEEGRIVRFAERTMYGYPTIKSFEDAVFELAEDLHRQYDEEDNPYRLAGIPREAFKRMFCETMRAVHTNMTSLFEEEFKKPASERIGGVEFDQVVMVAAIANMYDKFMPEATTYQKLLIFNGVFHSVREFAEQLFCLDGFQLESK